MIQLYAAYRRHNLDLKTHTLDLNTYIQRLKVKRWEKIHYANNNQQLCGVTI